ncbi:MAG: hypothetical protein ACXWP5_15335 [Bdellovibrionota bacterium]
MPAHFLVISEKKEDIAFCTRVAASEKMELHVASSPQAVKDLLVDLKQVMVFWDAEDPRSLDNYEELIQRQVAPVKVFALTDGPLNEYQHLFKKKIFGHHLYRRFLDPAAFLYGRLATASITPHPFGLLRYFPADTKSQKIQLTRSTQKGAAVAAVQNYLKKVKVVSRLAAQVAQAADELLMNAIFDAPTLPGGEPSRRQLARSADFELKGRDIVELEIASTPELMGISVADQYGSLKKEAILGFFQKDYQEEAYKVRREDPGAGLGLYGISQAGVSLLFVSKPGLRTEVMIFFPRTENYKDFRSGFRFTSIISE